MREGCEPKTWSGKIGRTLEPMSNVYNYVKESIGQEPRKWMADAAKEITAAGEQVRLNR